jgi:hypothetical protein
MSNENGNLVFENKGFHSILRVRQEEIDGAPMFVYRVDGSHQGEGFSDSWGCRNKWRAINAGKNAQKRIEAKISGMCIRRNQFRRMNRRR